MQTILGSGGSVGRDLARELVRYTDRIRLVSRHPKSVNETDELFPGDLSDPAQVMQAIEGSEVVYLTIGFEYRVKVWREKWPTFMRAVLDGCKQNSSKLVFFDNVYMYDRKNLWNMTEATTVNPTSEKGKVRAQIADMILEEVKAGTITALIARSADFYGPNIGNSVLMELVYKNLQKGKRAYWFADGSKRHTFTYTPDAAKATALLGNTPDAYGQVWHLPTDQNAPTGKEWVELFARELVTQPKYFVVPSWILGLVGVFVPLMKELHEMVYQYDRDYIFNSSKIEQRFKLKPTPYHEGVRTIVQHQGR